jgi:hypothetical protein
MQPTVIDGRGNSVSLHAHCDKLYLDLTGAAKFSIEYAKARYAFNEDYKEMYKKNQALAKRLKKENRSIIIKAMGGVVSKNDKDRFIITFPDASVATL